MTNRFRQVARQLLRHVPPFGGIIAGHERLAAEVDAWRAERLRSMTGSKTMQDAILDLLHHLTPSRTIGVAKTRLGRDGDGGYVMLDDFDAVGGALSFGIETDCSWDTDIAGRGIDVYQFDHTVNGPPEANPRFHFFKHRIAAVASDTTDSIGSALAKVAATGSARVILKIDIEGAEWEALAAATPEELGRFSQILGEFHGFCQIDDPAWRSVAAKVFRKLDSIFAVAHVHANNYEPLRVIANVPVADVYEITFANRSMYQFEPTDELLPSALDQPNSKASPDIFLGNMRFR